MATCSRCSTPLPEGATACPKCEGADYPKMDEALRGQLGDLNRKWSMHPFSSGWRIVDIALRVLVIFVLVGLTISLNARIEAAQFQGRQRLDGHRSLLSTLEKARTLNEAQLEELRRGYGDLHVSASEMFEAEMLDRKLHIYVLLGFIALLAVSALGSYRTYKEIAKLRSGFEFMFTYEGRKVLDRVAPKQDEAKP